MDHHISDPSKKSIPTPHPPSEAHHSEKAQAEKVSPVAAHEASSHEGAKKVDHFGLKELNEVMQQMKGMVIRPEKQHELAARQTKQQGGVQQKAGQQEKAELTAFEKVFVAHFDGGEKLGQALPQGKFRFLGKTENEWKGFFQRFLPFTASKKVPASELEAMIYRGVLNEDALLISDLKFVNGKTDKFARLEIQGSELLQTLSQTLPGDVLAQAVIAEIVGGPELAYLTLSHRVVNPEAVKGNSIAEAYQSPKERKSQLIREGTKQTTQGMALSAKTEQLMAERLDIKLTRPESRQDSPALAGSTITQRAKGKRRGFLGLFSWGSEDVKDTSIDKGSYFGFNLPAQLKRQRFPGKVKWFVPLLYFVGFSAAALFAFYIFKFLLQR